MGHGSRAKRVSGRNPRCARDTGTVPVSRFAIHHIRNTADKLKQRTMKDHPSKQQNPTLYSSLKEINNTASFLPGSINLLCYVTDKQKVLQIRA